MGSGPSQQSQQRPQSSPNKVNGIASQHDAPVSLHLSLILVPIMNSGISKKKTVAYRRSVVFSGHSGFLDQ